MQNIFGANGSEGPDPGPDPGPAHRCPPRLTDRHTQAVPCHCRFCLWSKNMAGLKVDLVHQVLDITLQFVSTLSTRALLDYFPCSLLGLPWSLFTPGQFFQKINHQSHGPAMGGAGECGRGDRSPVSVTVTGAETFALLRAVASTVAPPSAQRLGLPAETVLEC